MRVDDMENFAEYVAQERERLTAKRQTAMDARHQADLDLASVEAEFHAINAYEAAKTGKRVATNGSGRKRRSGGSRRQEVLAVIQNSTGLKRRGVLEALGVKGDETQEMSVSNALAALIKGGLVARTSDGYYIGSEQPIPLSADATAGAEAVAA
jgi:hypothetical protein